ncbi:MAG TPA: hypothetical protein VLQ79_11175, partial [Myxococcaceae bacterium]|nr:hypothetical protein [Myxococcaceae bacterium]
MYALEDRPERAWVRRHRSQVGRRPHGSPREQPDAVHAQFEPVLANVLRPGELPEADPPVACGGTVQVQDELI